MATGALSIKLRCASWQQLATIYKRDLSNGTMFLKASSPPPIGTPIRIDLTLPSASVIVLTGVVQQHVADPQRGAGVELALTPIAAGSIWLIESALGSDQRKPTPAAGVPIAAAPTADGDDLIAAETELARALVAEAESLKKINPFLVLGVGYEASDGDVRAAFGELTKRYHPDRFARYESAELRAVAAEIFILIRDAYRKLGNAAGRTQALAAIHRPAVPAAGPRLPTAQIPARTPPTSTPARPAAEPIKRAEPPPAPPAAVPRVTIPMAAVPDPAVLQIQLQQLDQLLDEARLDEALAGYHALAKRQPQDRTLRAGIELCEGLLALGLRDRLGAAQRFETALEIDPSNERAARELAEMRRQATNERKGLLSRLMGKREP